MSGFRAGIWRITFLVMAALALLDYIVVKSLFLELKPLAELYQSAGGSMSSLSGVFWSVYIYMTLIMIIVIASGYVLIVTAVNIAGYLAGILLPLPSPGSDFSLYAIYTVFIAPLIAVIAGGRNAWKH